MNKQKKNQSDKNVWLVVVNEPVFYGRLYTRLLKNAGQNIEAVVMLPALNQGSWKAFFKDVNYRYGLWGFKGFIYAVWLTLKAKVLGTGDVAKAAKDKGLPVYYCDNVKQANKIMKGYSPSLVISTVVEKVSAQVLDSVPGGWINTHCSPLPKYAGMDAPFWCLYNKETRIGVTLHYMNEAFDKGPIISQQIFENDGRSYFATVERLFDAAYELHVEFQASLTPTLADASQQDMAQYSYFGKPAVELGRRFRQNGGRFV